MRRFTGKLLMLVAVFCAIAAMAAAQDKPAAAATMSVPGPRGEFLDEVGYYEQRFTRLADAIPARCQETPAISQSKPRYAR